MHNSLTIEYCHPQSNKWTITKCKFVQTWPKRRVIENELPKSLALELATKLVSIEQFKVTIDKWLDDGRRIIVLSQDRQAIVARKEAELREREKAEQEALHNEHLRKLELAQMMGCAYCHYDSLQVFTLYGNSEGLLRKRRYELYLEDKLNTAKDEQWVKQMYRNAA